MIGVYIWIWEYKLVKGKIKDPIPKPICNIIQIIKQI